MLLRYYDNDFTKLQDAQFLTPVFKFFISNKTKLFKAFSKWTFNDYFSQEINGRYLSNRAL